MKGKAHVYERAHINTDEIIPARYMTSDKEEELAKHAMEDIDTEFVKKVEKGDFIVAGDDFGCGSSREHAIWALRGSGIKAVIANSFARIFFRNAVNIGLPIIEVPEFDAKTGDTITVDLRKGIISNITAGKESKFGAFPDFLADIISSGGLMNRIKNR